MIVRLLIFLLLVASPAWAAIAVEATSSGDSGANLQASLTFSHTVPGSLSDSVLIVGVTVGTDGDTVTGVTYGGTGMTRIRTDSIGAGARSYLYRLLAPTSGTADVVISVSPNSRITGGAITFSGVDQTTPFGTATGNSGNSTGPATVNVTSATGEVVVDCVTKRDSTEALTIGEDQTSQWADETTNATASNNTLGAGSTEPGAATVTMSWSWTGATRAWAISAVPLKPSGAATPTPTPTATPTPTPTPANKRRAMVVQ